MKMKRYSGTLRKVIHKGTEMVRLAVLCTFAVLLGILFTVMGVVYSLADCVVRKLGKDGEL